MAQNKKHVSASEWRLVGLLNVTLFVLLVLTVVYGFITNAAWHSHDLPLHHRAKEVHLVLGLCFIGFACVHAWVNKWWYERWGRGIAHSVGRWFKRCFGLLYGIVFAVVAATGLFIWLFDFGIGPWHVVMGIIFMGMAAVHILFNVRGLWRGVVSIVE